MHHPVGVGTTGAASHKQLSYAPHLNENIVMLASLHGTCICLQLLRMLCLKLSAQLASPSLSWPLPQLFLAQLAEAGSTGARLPPPGVLRVLKSAACRGAVKFGDMLTRAQAGELTEQVGQMMQLPQALQHAEISLLQDKQGTVVDTLPMAVPSCCSWGKPSCAFAVHMDARRLLLWLTLDCCKQC